MDLDNKNRVIFLNLIKILLKYKRYFEMSDNTNNADNNIIVFESINNIHNLINVDAYMFNSFIKKGMTNFDYNYQEKNRNHKIVRISPYYETNNRISLKMIEDNIILDYVSTRLNHLKHLYLQTKKIYKLYRSGKSVYTNTCVYSFIVDELFYEINKKNEVSGEFSDLNFLYLCGLLVNHTNILKTMSLFGIDKRLIVFYKSILDLTIKPTHYGILISNVYLQKHYVKIFRVILENENISFGIKFIKLNNLPSSSNHSDQQLIQPSA